MHHYSPYTLHSFILGLSSFSPELSAVLFPLLFSLVPTLATSYPATPPSLSLLDSYPLLSARSRHFSCGTALQVMVTFLSFSIRYLCHLFMTVPGSDC